MSGLTDRLVDAGAIHPEPRSPTTFSVDDLTVVTPQLGGTVARDGRITVDDGSEPPLADATVRLERNRGPSAARNRGRARATTPLVAFVDADVSLPFRVDDDGPDARAWWQPLIAHFDDPSVGLVAPRVDGDPGSSLDLGTEPARVRSGTRVSYVPAAMIVVRVDAFDDVGGFDETLRVGEDVDLVWRLDEAGWRCRYDPRRRVLHRRRSSLRLRLRQQVGYGSSSGPLALRHPRALAPFRASVPVAVALACVAIGRPVGAVVAVGVSVVRVLRSLPDVPTRFAARLVVTSHVEAARHASRAIRRQWWPIALFGALVSRRARRLALVVAAVVPRTLLLDLAFGWGVWRSMITHRTWRPIVPDLHR